MMLKNHFWCILKEKNNFWSVKYMPKDYQTMRKASGIKEKYKDKQIEQTDLTKQTIGTEKNVTKTQVQKIRDTRGSIKQEQGATLKKNQNNKVLLKLNTQLQK